MSTWRLLAIALLGLSSACGPSSAGGDGGPGDPDAGGPPEECNPSSDWDGDGIDNGTEGCELDPPRDTDGDGDPNWIDPDSDNDGVEDQYEDTNGDGQIGNCTTSCASAAQCPPDYFCSLPEDGASIGYCVHPECLDGETSPWSDDTDGDGQDDGVEGTWVCRPADETNPNGLKEVKYADSAGEILDSNPDWRIALELDAINGPATVVAPGNLESGYLFDLSDPDAEVAGFLVTRAALAGEVDAPSASQAGVQAIGQIGPIVLRSSGTRNQSSDGQDTILETTVTLTVASTDVTALRNAVMPALMARAPGDLMIPSTGWTGPATTTFAVHFQTVYRSGATPQVLFMGSVTALSDFDDPALATGFHANDLANGTGLTYSGNGEAIECEQFLVATVPKADIIWVVDESGSMDDDRQNVSDNATAFFQKAVLAGLDFRMGVTDMHNGMQGLFATRALGTSTGDRWLTPDELSLFMDDINDPSGPDPADGGTENGLIQGRDALTRHLPRNDGDPSKVRTDAQLVVIYVTDEHAEEVEEAGILGEGGGVASAAQKAQIAQLVNQNYLPQFLDNDAIAHLIGVPESTPGCSGGGGEIAYGYFDMVNGTGGQFGSICQADLGATLDAIIDDIVGSASPITLEYIPISATIAVARDNLPVPRSRSQGWDYRASSNSIIFYDMPFDPLSPSEVVISYRRWDEQVPIE
jgi:hypothetical protein